MNFGKYIAHRGLFTDTIPENSLKAFEAAAEKGFAAELDVRLTKDCKMVIFHDSSLLRMCGVDESLSEFTYEQLSAFTLNGTSEKIPLFADVLRLINGRVPILVEIKDGAPIGELEKRVCHILSQYDGEYAVESFNPFSMLWFRIHAPKIKRGQLVSEFKDSFDFEYIARKICARPFVWKLISKPDFIAADLRSVSMEQLFAALDMDADFITWTVNSDSLMESAQQFSKTVIFENIKNLSHNFSDNYDVD